MGYINVFEAYGYEKFAKNASISGVDGILAVDLPPEEADDFYNILDKFDINLIFLVSLTTSTFRLKLFKNKAKGFIYLISLKGITGSKLNIGSELKNCIQKIYQNLNIPVCIGFGINEANTAKKVSLLADGIIVGSSIVSIMDKYNNKDLMMNKILEFSESLIQAIK